MRSLAYGMVSLFAAVAVACGGLIQPPESVVKVQGPGGVMFPFPGSNSEEPKSPLENRPVVFAATEGDWSFEIKQPMWKHIFGRWILWGRHQIVNRSSKKQFEPQLFLRLKSLDGSIASPDEVLNKDGSKTGEIIQPNATESGLLVVGANQETDKLLTPGSTIKAEILFGPDKKSLGVFDWKLPERTPDDVYEH